MKVGEMGELVSNRKGKDVEKLAEAQDIWFGTDQGMPPVTRDPKRQSKAHTTGPSKIYFFGDNSVFFALDCSFLLATNTDFGRYWSLGIAGMTHE